MTPAELLFELCRAWERRDVDAVASLFAPAGRYEDPLFDETPVGPDAIRDACAPAIADLAKVEIPFRLSASTPEVAFAEGSFLSETTDCARMEFRLAMLVEAEGGLITRFAEYFDPRPLLGS